MALIRRLSDVWSYLSPTKSANPLPTPPTAPNAPTFKKPLRPASQSAIHDLSRHARSMSPGERVGSWRVRSPESQASRPAIGRKRRRSSTPRASGAGRRKVVKRTAQDSAYGGEMEDLEGDTLMGEEYGNEYGNDYEEEYGNEYEDEYHEYGSQGAYSSPGIQCTRSPSRSDYDDFEGDDMSVDATLVIAEGEDTPMRPKPVNLPEQHSVRHVSTEELRAKGWDDDYIALIQKIAVRGHEPLLPRYMKFEYTFLPDALFEQRDSALLSSARGDHFRAGKELERLFDLGARVRDLIYVKGKANAKPEALIRSQLKGYRDWAYEDAGINRHTSIPILATEFQPSDVDVVTLRANATRKCRRLAARYREALRVQRSVEISPGQSSNGTIQWYPLPTFYAIVASHAIVALMGYNPNQENPECQSMAIFDLKDSEHDVWNALSFAIVLVHVRNVQMRIAEETGIGMPPQGFSDRLIAVDDPDA